MRNQLDPFKALIQITSEENFYLVQSSNKIDVYGVLITGPGAALCSCKAGSLNIPCRHRASVLARFPYVSPWDDTLTDEQWAAIQARIEMAAELEAVKELFGNEAA